MTYITPDKVFAHMDRLVDWQHGKKPSPVTVEWDLTNVCSLGCQACHFAHTHLRGPHTGAERPEGYTDTGAFADPDLVRRGLTEMAWAGVKGVVWSGGGEPTLHPDHLAIFAHAARQGLRQGMYTLGGHFTEESAVRVASTLDWVVVSLDAAGAETYARDKKVIPERFHAACRGIRWLAQAGRATVGVSFMLSDGNWRQAHAMLALAREHGATYSTFRPLIETDAQDPQVVTASREWVTDAMETLEELATEPDVECTPERFAAYRDWLGHDYDTCYGIRLNCTVTPDGRVWVCPQRRGIAGSEVGDLRTESFAALWERHPGAWTDFSGCRAMCRLHQTNQTLARVYALRPHEAFV